MTTKPGEGPEMPDEELVLDLLIRQLADPDLSVRYHAGRAILAAGFYAVPLVAPHVGDIGRPDASRVRRAAGQAR
jgi:hypothetical protein